MCRKLPCIPDVVVTCGEELFADENVDTLLNPIVIIEVLSKSTADYDLGKKFEHYRALDSVEEVIFADSETLHVLHYRRRKDGNWILSETRDRASRIDLPSIDVALEVSEVYAKVGISPHSAPVSLH